MKHYASNIKKITLSLLFLFLTGCAGIKIPYISFATPETLLPGADKVVVSKIAPDSGGMNKGSIVATHGGGCGFGGFKGHRDGALIAMKNRAIRMGANYVQIQNEKGPYRDSNCAHNEYRIEGNAYLTSDGADDPNLPKLASVEVLPPSAAEADGFVFELQGCNQSLQTIRCEFFVTNTESDRSLVIFKHSRIFDSSGNEYTAAKVKIANTQTSGYADRVNKNLLSKIRTKASLKFEGILPDTSALSALEIISNGFNVQFRNIGDQKTVRKKAPEVKMEKRSFLEERQGIEKDFISIKPVEAEGFVFELQGCRKSFQAIKCEFFITNTESDRTLAIFLRSRIFDSSGNEYKAARVKIANTQTSGYADRVNKNLISKIRTKASLNFKGIPDGTSRLSVLEIIAGGFNVQFRDVLLNKR